MDRAESTIYGYLAQFISHDQIMDPTPWVDENTSSRIRQAIEEVGTGALRPIFEYLNEEISYSDIRVVVACLVNAES